MANPRTARPILFALMLMALCIRLAWGIAQPSTDAAIDKLPDQREYLSLGRNLLEYRSLSFIDPRFEQLVFAYRTPGYPVFIALLGGSPHVVRYAQAIVDTSTILAIFLIARQLSGDVILALTAAAITAVNPFLIYFSGLLLSETLFTASLAWSICLLIRRRLLGGAVLALLAVLIRPSAIGLMPILAAFTAMNSPASKSYSPYRRGIPWPRVVAATLVVTGVVFLGLASWAFRNHRALGSWIWTTTNGGITLYDGFNPTADGSSNQQFVAGMPELQSMNEVQRSRYLEQAARSWAGQNSEKLPGLTLRKIARTWSPLPLSAEFGRPMYRLISALYAVPFDLLVLVGIFSPRLGRAVKMLLLTPAVYFTVLHALSVGSLRYRVPVEPELAVLAAAGTLRMQNAKCRMQNQEADEANFQR